MATFFQNMFPPINVQEMKIAECRRVVLFNYVEEEAEEHDDGGGGDDEEKKKTGEQRVGGTVEFRHYSVQCKNVSVTRTVRRIVETRLPDLSSLSDISEYVLG